MMELLSAPIENEHIYSWHLRMYQRSGSSSFKSYQHSLGIDERFLHANSLFKSTTASLVSLLASIGITDTSNHTNAPIWQLSIGERIDASFGGWHTLTHMNEQLLFGFDASWHSCPTCRAEDIDTHGTTYWHAPHQLPSIVRCYKHDTLLERAEDPVKNLYTELLPHDVSKWQNLITKEEHDIEQWQQFFQKVHAMSIEQPDFISSLKLRITTLLGLDIQNRSAKAVICNNLNPSFESVLGPALLHHLYRDYTRPTKRGNTNILRSMFSNPNPPSGQRNPVYWLSLAYWMRAELGM
ncbi:MULTISPECIES: TniQ family protein [Vibrio harveyi group]|uniref:TniQ family protein n=1 Tax=Vibrio harveyi group TaxID=717610 RepID=UPI00285AAB6B|nr:hypothetical protein [Vibrio alginolyticus]